jgi:hypothetical protein
MVEEVNSTMIYLIYCKNFFKCHNVSPLSTTIKKKEPGEEYISILIGSSETLWRKKAGEHCLCIQVRGGRKKQKV